VLVVQWRADSFVVGFGWLSQAGTGSHYLAGVLGPTLLVAIGIGLVFPTLMASATADVPRSDAGVVGGLANTASQVGGSIALAVYATAAAANDSASALPETLASGYELVFGLAAGVALAIAAVSLLLPTRQRT
jgi:sugar phosphate permease